MIDSGDLAMSFSGLKTAVMTAVRKLEARGALDAQAKADLAREFESAVVDVLAAKAIAALDDAGRRTLVVAGGVGANLRLRARLVADAARRGAAVHFPDIAFCTDNGAMIALAGALRLHEARRGRRLHRAAALGPGVAACRLTCALAPDRAFLAGQQLADVRLVAPDSRISMIGTIAQAIGALPAT